MPAIGPYAYPFDPSGAEVSNKVLNEIQVVTAVNSNEYHIVVPNFAPFFRASLIVLNGGTMTPLVEGTDFIFTHKYKEATINTAIPIYGSITLLNKNFSGVLVFQEYQTVGGQWTLTTTLINQILADKMLNPRITTWEQLGVAPEHFPVIDHMHVDPEELIGMPELVQAIEDVGIAVSGIVIDYDAINAYADSKIQDSMSPTQTTKAPSVRAVLEALSNKADATALTDYVLDTQIVQDLNTPSTTNVPSVDAVSGILADKANDNAVVHLTGNETIDGTKTFQVSPQLPDVGTDDTDDSNNAASTKFVQNVFSRAPQILHMTWQNNSGDGNLSTAAGVAGGSDTNQTWNRRVLNTVVQNTIPGASIVTVFDGVFNLPAGRFRTRIQSVNCQLTRPRLALKTNVLAGFDVNDLYVPSISYSSDSADNVVIDHEDILEIATPKQFGVYHWWYARGTTDRLGVDSVSGLPNVFLDVKIEKIG